MPNVLLRHQLVTLAVWLALLGLPAAAAESAAPLQAAFDARGLSSLRYRGAELLLSSAPEIYSYYVATDQGIGSIDSQKGQPAFDEATHTLTVPYGFGEVSYRYTPEADRLRVHIVISNRGPWPVWHAYLRLLELNLPNPLAGAAAKRADGDSYDNVPVAMGDFGSGVVALAGETFSEDYGVGLSQVAGKRITTYAVQVRAEARSARDLQHQDATIPVGGSKSYDVSLRFAPGGSTLKTVAGDLFARYAKEFPAKLKWPDRRPIAALFGSSPAKEHQSATNPRGWRNAPKWDVFSKGGQKRFREEMLKWADGEVASLKTMNAQGMILWDVEGEEQPHPITYIGDPRLGPKMAPEFDAIADEFFAKFTTAGLRTGVCIRPSHVELAAVGPGRLKATHGHMGFDPVEEMTAKIAYAKKRWGCTLFYLDSNATFAFEPPDKAGNRAVISWIMRAEKLRKLQARFPDVLIIPELSYPGYYSSVSPYKELRGGTTSTAEPVRLAYPNAFTVIKMDDEQRFEERRAELLEAVRRGDVLLFTGRSDASINQKTRALYEQARAR